MSTPKPITALNGRTLYIEYEGVEYYPMTYFEERTCEFADDSDGEPSPPKCSVCGYDPGIYECAWYDDGTYGYERNYCPNCGARILEENDG